jgi:hypothetical protein
MHRALRTVHRSDIIRPRQFTAGELMAMGTVLFLLLRALHVLMAAVWVGSTVFITMIVMPTVEGVGPAGGQVMIGMNRRGLSAYFGVLGGLTALTGIYLLWRFTGGFSPEISRSHAGMAFGIGGVAGLLATILGGAVVGRAAKNNVDVMVKAGPMSDGPEKRALLQTAQGLQQTMKTWGTIVLALQLIALLLMSVAHYI